MGMRHIPLKNVRITDGFWSPRQRLMTDVTIPYMESILRDEVPGAEKSHAISNFRMAAGEETGEFYGMVFQDSDFATKLVGFEVSQMGPHGYDGSYDLENDWHAVFYYYGYLGFALYVGFMLYFLLRILRSVRADLKRSLTLENFAYLLCLFLIIGLAHFSGATLRRPNVSIWLSLVLALIYYVTEENRDEA